MKYSIATFLQDKNRNRFFLSHLVMSILVIGIFLCIALFFWYPSPLAWAMGVLPILTMLVIIDVFVGPIFGFLVYKTGKKTLKMDLAVIIIIQIVAFCYGAYSIAQSRPAWIVHHGNTFSVVRRVDASSNNFTQSNKPGFGIPKVVSYKSRKNSISAQLLSKSINQLEPENDIRNPAFYDNIDNTVLKGWSLAVLNQFNDKNEVDAVLANYPEASTWYGLITSGKYDLVVLIDEQGKIVDIVKLKPWK